MQTREREFGRIWKFFQREGLDKYFQIRSNSLSCLHQVIETQKNQVI